MAKMVSIGIFFFVLFSILLPIDAMAVRDIPEDNLAYPVQISLSNCKTDNRPWGSGFFIDTGKSLYLITARHVIFKILMEEGKPNFSPLCKETRLSSYSANPKEKQQILYSWI